MAMSKCDLIIAVGARFDDRVTGKLESFSPDSKKIHIDIDPSCISKNVPVNGPIVGHARHILPILIDKIKKYDLKNWIEQIYKWKNEHPLQYRKNQGFIPPQYVIEKVSEVTKGEAVVVTDVGQNQMWTAQYYQFKNSRSMLSSGGLGTMGYSLPAAVGAALGNPGKKIISISGDGGFQMNAQELATAVYYQIPLKIIILNNGFLGMVRQWQDLFCEKRYSQTYLKGGNPDFIALAESFGAQGVRVEKIEHVENVLQESMKVRDKPFVMEFLVSPEENVFPMVPAGASLTEMIEI
jgi:acetolactate synthase-1/2/3 large subunit